MKTLVENRLIYAHNALNKALATFGNFWPMFADGSVKTGEEHAMATKAKVKTEAAFTPGPWYDQNAWGERINIRDEASDYVLAVVDDGGHVDPEFSLDWEVMQANGRLMAASPKLLAALEAALAVHGDGYSWGKDAREAIRQARGQ